MLCFSLLIVFVALLLMSTPPKIITIEGFFAVTTSSSVHLAHNNGMRRRKERIVPTTTTTTTILRNNGGLTEDDFDDDDDSDDNADNDDLNDSGSDSSADDDSREDIDTTRHRLEHLLSYNENGDDASTTSSKSSVNKNEVSPSSSSFSFSKLLSEYDDGIEFTPSALPELPPLSSIERDRRLIEIQLLQCLANDNDVMEHLWTHWYSERGDGAKLLLQQTDDYLADPTLWTKCEQNLIAIIEDYGIYFLEPVNRLATLYYLQRKFQTSYQLCQLILYIKPYHVGALSGIVQVCVGLGDADMARKYWKQRLPSIPNDDIVTGDNEEEVTDRNRVVRQSRRDWVDRAVGSAKDLLEERMTARIDFFGQRDTPSTTTTTTTNDYSDENRNNYNNDNNNSSMNKNIDDDDDEMDAWQ